MPITEMEEWIMCDDIERVRAESEDPRPIHKVGYFDVYPRGESSYLSIRDQVIKEMGGEDKVDPVAMEKEASKRFKKDWNKDLCQKKELGLP